MLAYLKRAREHKEFLLRETKEYERGKRHLANIMGIESESMTQRDVDDAIKYLFPAALFEPRARPVMKHPELIYQARKDAQFDIEGRPNHYLFYTFTANFHEDLHKLTKINEELNAYEDEQLLKGIVEPPPEAMYQFAGRTWRTHREMCDEYLEDIKEVQYEYMIKCLTRLAEHPYSARAKEYLDHHTKELPGQSISLELPKLLKDETTGKIYTEMISRRREHDVHVKTILNGSGKIEINGEHDILYFNAPYMRRAIHLPLAISNMLDKVDIIANVIRQPIQLGKGCVAMAIRYAVATSVATFRDIDVRERMRLAGLLTIDTRRKERKKFGQEGARRKYTWKKR